MSCMTIGCKNMADKEYPEYIVSIFCRNCARMNSFRDGNSVFSNILPRVDTKLPEYTFDIKLSHNTKNKKK